MNKIILAAVSALVMHCALAEEFVVVGMGAGANSCGQWLSSRRSNDTRAQNIMLTWLQGQVSGMNMAQPDSKMILLPASSVIEASADKDCADEPTTPLAFVGAKLYWKLSAQNGKRR